MQKMEDIKGYLTFRDWQVEWGYTPLGMYDHMELEMYASYQEAAEDFFSEMEENDEAFYAEASEEDDQP